MEFAVINILDSETINKIAAGEVVERPSSVVKELVENSIDAGSTAITIEIKEGGISFIRITDNGCGIPKEDITKAFLRHATSKIKSVEDLLSVSSLGFRGEALSSIASVSQVELITKTADEVSGYRYTCEGGTEGVCQEVGAPEGTTIVVRNIFYNTPVRRKFLKTASTEAGYVSSLVEHLALSHPDISFRFINNNQNKLHTSGNMNLLDIIYGVYGRDVARSLIKAEGKTQDIKLEGFIGTPAIVRGNRSYENYYINGRYIKSGIITKAIEDAYKPYSMNHKFPFTSLHLQMDPNLVDVNVHPTKLEVRFKNANDIYEFVYNSIKDVLQNKEHISQVKLVKEKETPKNVNRPPEPFEEERIKENKNLQTSLDRDRFDNVSRDSLGKKPNNTSNYTYNYNATSVERYSGEDISPETRHQVEQKISDTEIGKLREAVKDPNKIIEQERRIREDAEQLSFLSEEAMKDHRIIGQVFATYWLIEYNEKLYIIDQHAAHEKVLYEKILKDYKEKNIITQNLNPPIILTFSMREQEVLTESLEEFEKLGFEIEEFGGNEYAIRAIPSDLDGLAQKEIFIELIDNLTDEVYNSKAEVLVDKIASISCKAAVKGNQKLSVREVSGLIDSLLKLENPYYCPHGRPTMIAISKYELEKKFKRVL